MRLRNSLLALAGVAALGLLLGCPLGDGTSPPEPPVFEVDTDAGAGLTGVYECSLAWGDYDNDGDLDLALSGCEDRFYSVFISKVYRNEGGTLADIGAGLVGVVGSLAWGDYDNDGDLDLALSGCEDRFHSVFISKVYRNDGGTFVDALVGIEDVAGVLAWGDYDNDGDLDLALAGRCLTGPVSLVYRNEEGTFTGIDMGLTGLSACSLAWGDYDGDGDLDLAVGGSDGPRSYVNKVFRNDGGAFTDAGILTTDFAAGSLAWGDYDGDGDLDLALSGGAQEADLTRRFESRICRNDGGIFTDIGAGLAGINGTVAWGDYDSDGDPDLLLAGWDRVVGHACHWDYYGAASKVYRNDGGTFTDIRARLVGLAGPAAWGDYDNDGDLDLALAGSETTEDRIGLAKVYRNDGGFLNTSPAPPPGLSVSAAGNDVTFCWLASTDRETPRRGLAYNLRAGTSPGLGDVFSGMADLASGRRLLPALGNAQKRRSWTIRGLRGGTYYWSVQAVDPGFKGSAWAAERAVEVAGPGTTVKLPNGGERRNVGSTHDVTWSWAGGIADVRIELYRNGAWEEIAASTPNTGSYPWTVAGGPAKDCLVRVSDAAGGASDVSDAAFTISQFSDVGAGLTELSYTALAWGDYDSDGDLDLALAGSPGGSRIYRNDGGTFTDIGAGLPGMRFCSLAWGDYDSDGDLDLALAGSGISKVYRNEGGAFRDIGAGLTGVSYCSLAWGDCDNDGDLDLALAGEVAYRDHVSIVYRNDGGAFTDIHAGLTGVKHCSLAWGDYDGDGDLDLALAGEDDDRFAISKVYRNDGGTFTDIGAGLTGVRCCALAWGDYDSDGDLDLALAGHDGNALVSKVYRNDGGTFTDIGTGLSGARYCSLAWGDYDNDGDLDLALAGEVAYHDYASVVYRNDGGTFTDIGAGLRGASRCALAWGDYDGDGDLDLAVSGGGASNLYRNDGVVFNAPPAAPAGLSAAVAGDHLTLSWAASTDAETPQAGLTYGLRVGTTSGGDEVLSGMADLATGWRLLPATGVVQPVLPAGEWTLALPAGTYYWSVQAVDTAFAGSGWAAEEIVTLPVVVDSPDGGELWQVGSSQTASWNASGVAEVKIELSRDAGATWETIAATASAAAGSYSWTVTGPHSDECLLRVSDAASPAAADVSDSAFTVAQIIVTAPDGGESLPVGTATAVTWWSGSGVADVKIELSRDTGATWETIVDSTPAAEGTCQWTVTGPPSNECIVRVSDAAAPAAADTSADAFAIPRFVDIGAGLAGVYDCSLAWGDYDGDGDLDLVVAGEIVGDATTTVYRNEGGTFANIGAGLAGVGDCALAWGDYDNDGDLDLALAGEDGDWKRMSLVYRYGGGTFTDAAAGLRGVVWCCLAWGDYNNDGDLDLALAGCFTEEGVASKVYRNDGGTFTDIGAELAAAYDGALAWGDYDGDGDLDLALAGCSTEEGIASKVYRNDGGAFTDIGAGLTGASHCSLAWGDYDNDGDLDLALAGSVAYRDYVSVVYRNDGGVFTDIAAGLPGVDRCSLAWGDYDSDGDLDLALAGVDVRDNELNLIYRNDGGTFTDINAELTGVSWGPSLAWGDYDGDGDLDLAIAGRGGGSKVYRNDGGVFNAPPAAPTGLGASYVAAGPDYDVTFSWAAPAVADETPEAGLSYNLRVGTTSGGNEVLSGMARADGRRKLPARGVVQPGLSVNEWTLTLPAGTYYWSVQAVDTVFAGSAWPAEQTTTVP